MTEAVHVVKLPGLMKQLNVVSCRDDSGCYAGRVLCHVDLVWDYPVLVLELQAATASSAD